MVLPGLSMSFQVLCLTPRETTAASPPPSLILWDFEGNENWPHLPLQLQLMPQSRVSFWNRPPEMSSGNRACDPDHGLPVLPTPGNTGVIDVAEDSAVKNKFTRLCGWTVLSVWVSTYPSKEQKYPVRALSLDHMRTRCSYSEFQMLTLVRNWPCKTWQCPETKGFILLLKSFSQIRYSHYPYKCLILLWIMPSSWHWYCLVKLIRT